MRLVQLAEQVVQRQGLKSVLFVESGANVTGSLSGCQVFICINDQFIDISTASDPNVDLSLVHVFAIGSTLAVQNFLPENLAIRKPSG